MGIGAARLTQIFLPLIRRANGRIVFVSSGKNLLFIKIKDYFVLKWDLIVDLALARVPAPVRGAQCATQAGIEGLATCLKQELRPRGVDVSIVAAGEFASGTAWLSESTMLEQVNCLFFCGQCPIKAWSNQLFFLIIFLLIFQLIFLIYIQKARNMWSQLSAEQKSNYGEDYFETALRSLEKYTERV